MSDELQLLLILAIIITASKIAGHLSQRYLNQPVVFGEILAGLVLGPTLLNIFGWPIFHPGSAESWRLEDHVKALASVGVLLLMFIAGLETNLEQMRKVGKTAIWTAICGVLFPLIGGVIVARAFGMNMTEAMFIGAVLTATSVSISAQTLMELGRLRSREGMTIMGAAVIDDVLGIIVLSFVIALGASHAIGSAGVNHESLAEMFAAPLSGMLGIPGGGAIVQILLVIVLMGLFFGAAISLGSRYLDGVLKWADGLNASHVIPATALVLVFLFAVAAEYFGQVAAITGAYIVGVFLARTRHAKKIEHTIHPFTYALFVPIFFMSIGLGTNAREALQSGVLFTLVIVGVAILTKAVGCGLGARLTGLTRMEATRVGVGMISRGEVGLIVAQVGIGYNLIQQPVYATLVIMVLVSTVVTPVLLRLVTPRVTEIDTPVFESVIAVETRMSEEQD
jgi:Kef-type K+ transport system membrane component KefB